VKSIRQLLTDTTQQSQSKSSYRELHNMWLPYPFISYSVKKENQNISEEVNRNGHKTKYYFY
jgi:hypothetical protein